MKKLTKSFDGILDRQEEYEIELANNRDFEAYTISDWERSDVYQRDPTFPKPQWGFDLDAFWSEPIRTESQLDAGILAIYDWRYQYGLEGFEKVETSRRRL